MAIEIFWSSGSPFAWRVLLALEVKGLAYESHLMQFSTRDHKAPSYLALNPRGQVPTLRDGGFVIYESIAIMAYLDRKYPAVPLFGASPEETGNIWRAVCEAMSYLELPADQFILPLYFGKAVEKAEQIRAVLPPIRAELARLEATLASAANTAWLAATPSLSAADIAVFPLVKSLLRAAGKPEAPAFLPGLLPFEEKYPALAGWLTRIEALPGYERTYPPHW
jgi:glutathione S-transferase